MPNDAAVAEAPDNKTPPALPPAPEPATDLTLFGDPSGLPASLRILLDDRAYDRTAKLATMMANARGITPAHLEGKPAACHAVIMMSLNWRLDPFFVAQRTYQTPGGAVGYMGALIHAILQQSGRIMGAVEFEYIGDWTKLAGMHKEATGARGGKFFVPTWTDKDAIGLGVRVIAQLRGEDKKRYWPSEAEWFHLVQCQPRNSPLWATDPRSQIAYLAVRRFGNQAVPDLLGGMPFDVDDLINAGDGAIDVTPLQEAQRGATVAGGQQGGGVTDVEAEPYLVYRVAAGDTEPSAYRSSA